MRKPPPQITQSDISEFLKQAELVAQSKYAKSDNKTHVDIQYKEGEGVKFVADIPPREDIEIVLQRIRPFIEYYERLHVGRVITYLLKEHGDSEFLRAYQLLFQPESEQEYPGLVFNNTEYRMRDLLILYMYGKYMHLDKDKQEVIAAFDKGIGPLAEYFGLSQIDKYIGVILGVAAYIRNNKLDK